MNIIKPDESIAPSKLELAICPSWMGSNVPNSLSPAPRIRTTDDEDPISRPNNSPPKQAVAKDGNHGGNNPVDDEEDEEDDSESLWSTASSVVIYRVVANGHTTNLRLL